METLQESRQRAIEEEAAELAEHEQRERLRQQESDFAYEEYLRDAFGIYRP